MSTCPEGGLAFSCDVLRPEVRTRVVDFLCLYLGGAWGPPHVSPYEFPQSRSSGGFLTYDPRVKKDNEGPDVLAALSYVRKHKGDPEVLYYQLPFCCGEPEYLAPLVEYARLCAPRSGPVVFYTHARSHNTHHHLHLKACGFTASRVIPDFFTSPPDDAYLFEMKFHA